MVLAVAPITDITLWVRSSGLLIVLYVTGAILLSRVVQWLAGREDRRAHRRAGRRQRRHHPLRDGTAQPNGDPGDPLGGGRPDLLLRRSPRASASLCRAHRLRRP